jgi:para-nitrobenzyl esterase
VRISTFGITRTRTWAMIATGMTVAAAIALLVAVASPFARATTDQPTTCSTGTTVNTASGPVCGFVSASGLTEWLGIPFAAPPVGALRWQPPQPPAPWNTTRPALQYPAPCEGNGPSSSEDCLYLNVIAPPHPSGTHLRTLVWIHGGGFQFGDSVEFPGDHLAQAGNVVFVSLQYRLGLLGFLANRAFGPHAGDYGLKDQQAGLQWVKTNIAAFGGDPRNVTIFGESAGGSSVCDQLASPTAAGLFEQAISESGFYNSVTGKETSFQPQDCKSTLPTESQADAAGQAFAQSVGCTNTQVASCLRNLPVSTLLADNAGPTGPTNSPIINGTTLTTSPRTAFATGRFNRVPTIMGTLRDEDLIASPTTAADFEQTVRAQYGAFAPLVLATYPLNRYDSPYIDFRTIAADSDTVCPSLQAETNISRWTRIWGYEIYDTDAPTIGGRQSPTPQGAFHAGELQLLFPGFVGSPPVDANQQALADQMTAEWTGFARTGNPSALGTPVWPSLVSRQGTLMELQPAGDSQLTTIPELSAVHHCALWNSIASHGA